MSIGRFVLWLQGLKPTESSVELAIDSIQFGAPSSAGSTDSDGVSALLETASENKLPAPKEQRQKQPRAGPIKTQKVIRPELEFEHFQPRYVSPFYPSRLH